MYFYIYELKKLILFKTGEKKTSVVKSKTYFSRKAIENLLGKVLKENFIIGRSWSSAKLFIVQNYIENANEDVGDAFNSRKCVIFLVSLSSRCAYFLYKIYFYSMTVMWINSVNYLDIINNFKGVVLRFITL